MYTQCCGVTKLVIWDLPSLPTMTMTTIKFISRPKNEMIILGTWVMRLRKWAGQLFLWSEFIVIILAVWVDVPHEQPPNYHNCWSGTGKVNSAGVRTQVSWLNWSKWLLSSHQRRWSWTRDYKRSCSVSLTLGQSRWRWPNIEPALRRCLWLLLA